MADKDVFTEEELPRGKMMLVGRRYDGKEIACMIFSDMDAEYYERTVRMLNNALGGVSVDIKKIEEILNG